MKELFVNFIVLVGFIFGTVTNLALLSDLIHYIKCSFIQGDLMSLGLLMFLMVCSLTYGMSCNYIFSKF